MINLTIEETPSRFGSPFDVAPTPWEPLGENVYRCRVLLCEEDEGGFSAHALRLPGVVSEGDTMDEALANIREAFCGAIRSYLDDNEDVPWEDVDVGRSGIEKHILVTI